MTPGEVVGELIAAGVAVDWLASPDTRIPQVFRMARMVAKAKVRESGRMATAVRLAFDEHPERKIADLLRRM